MAKPTNRWDRLIDTLADKALARSDRLVEKLRGGKLPPGHTRVPRAEQLREYMLLARPVASLSPEEAKQADELWRSKYSQQTEQELKLWALSMEHMRLQMVGHVPGEGMPELSEVPPEPEGGLGLPPASAPTMAPAMVPPVGAADALP